MKINNKKKLLKYLPIYRSFIFKFTKFETDSKDPELKKIIELLNIKNKYKRIYTTIDEICTYIDNYYKDKDICKFKNNKCICHRKQKLSFENGCCRKCLYQSNNGCTTKNFACKMFICSYVKENNKTLKYDDIILLKVLTPSQRHILIHNYFSTIEDVSKDLYYGVIFSIIRVMYRNTKRMELQYVNRNFKNKK